MKNNHEELHQRLQWFNFTFVLGNRKRNYAAPEEMTDQYSFIYLSKAACGETTHTHTHTHTTPRRRRTQNHPDWPQHKSAGSTHSQSTPWPKHTHTHTQHHTHTHTHTPHTL